MPCYYPLKGWIVGRDSVTGKKIVKVTSATDKGYLGFESFPVPCGRCIGCRLDYSKQWANRCMMEAKYHGRACFVTLTYDSAHVPFGSYSIAGKPASVPSLTLCKRDLQLFIKRLRKHFSDCHIRYFGCGEYGSSTFRPHYHLILFGVDFDDKVECGKSKTGQVMYESEQLNRIWSFPPRRKTLGESYSPKDQDKKEDDPKKEKKKRKYFLAGRAIVQSMTYETCAYVARYVTKKLKGPLASFYEERNMELPFCVMSRRPGIGRQYYEDHPELWDHEYINISTPEGGKQFRPPKYFMKLLEQDDPYSAEAMKEVRKAFALQQSMTLEELSKTEHDEYLNRLEDIQSAKINTLKRSAV